MTTQDQRRILKARSVFFPFPLVMLVVALAVLPLGCITGPVAQTREVEAMGVEEGRKLAELATRAVLARYQSAMAKVHTEWVAFATATKERRPSGTLTPDQAVTWATTVAETLLDGSILRDDKLAGLDGRRAVELQQINQLHANQVAALRSIVRSWAIQGEISQAQYVGWLEVAQKGATAYIENRSARKLRKEAEEAAKREAEAE